MHSSSAILLPLEMDLDDTTPTNPDEWSLSERYFRADLCEFIPFNAFD